MKEKLRDMEDRPRMSNMCFHKKGTEGLGDAVFKKRKAEKKNSVLKLKKEFSMRHVYEIELKCTQW